MKSWYTSQERFNSRIINRWEKRGFEYHNGHVNILRYAFRTLCYWSSLKGDNISKENKVEINMKLF